MAISPAVDEPIYDVVVVGSGASGLAAAIAARDDGASVLVLEAEGRPGGTTARSGGFIWVPNNSLLRARGLVDDRADALRYMSRTVSPDRYDPTSPTLGLRLTHYRQLCAFYDRGPGIVDRLTALDALRPVQEVDLADKPYSAMDWPDYFEYLPEDACPEGRSFRTAPQDVPIPDDLSKRPMLSGGWDLVQQLLSGLRRLGGDVRVSHRVRGALRNQDGEVVGVEAATEEGTTRIWARRGVVFASGGFAHDPQLRAELLRGPTFGGCAAAGSRGDFLKIGWELEAATGNLDNGWWQEVPFERALDDPGNQNNIMFVPGDSMIIVNRDGRRVANEKDTYHQRSQAHLVWDDQLGEYPNRVLFMVYDQRTADLAAGFVPVPAAGVPDPAVVRGTTVEELAENLRIRVDALAAATDGLSLSDDFAGTLTRTIDRFNRYAARGIDPDFRRGGQLLDLARNIDLPGHGPNPTLMPLAARGPYYAVLLGAGVLDTNGGPVIDENARVLSRTDRPIGGLYGAGNCIASPADGTYWAGGATLGLGMTFGFIAGEHAASQPDRLDRCTNVDLVRARAESGAMA